MNKFFMVFMAFIFSSMVFMIGNMFSNKSSAATYKDGLNAYLSVNHFVNRTPTKTISNK